MKVNNLKQENDKLSKIKEKTTVLDFKKNFELSNDLIVELTDKSGKVLSNDNYVGTNILVQIKNKTTKETLQEYTCIMYADVNEDGTITASDYVLIKNHLMEVKSITGTNNKKASDVNSDGSITASDYVLIKNHIMETKKLELK